MTIVIVSVRDVRWVRPTTLLLRERGWKVVVLATLKAVGFLLMSNKIAAVIVEQGCAPMDWEAARARLAAIAPETRILYIGREDSSSPAEIAALVAPLASP